MHIPALLNRSVLLQYITGLISVALMHHWSVQHSIDAMLTCSAPTLIDAPLTSFAIFLCIYDEFITDLLSTASMKPWSVHYLHQMMHQLICLALYSIYTTPMSSALYWSQTDLSLMQHNLLRTAVMYHWSVSTALHSPKCTLHQCNV